MRDLLPKILFAATALITAGVGCSVGRGRGEACTETGDCRDSLACISNECTPPGMCPTTRPVNCGGGVCCPQAADACCSDGKCYGSQAECKAATCKKTGQACRQSEDCCGDLTCQGGACKTETVLNWTVRNDCFNGEDVQFAFFSQNRPVEWPGGGLVFVSKQGSTVTQALSCVAGEKICFGGNQPRHALSWGAGIDNSLPCVNCCATCANASVSYGPLTCP